MELKWSKATGLSYTAKSLSTDEEYDFRSAGRDSTLLGWVTQVGPKEWWVRFNSYTIPGSEVDPTWRFTSLEEAKVMVTVHYRFARHADT